MWFMVVTAIALAFAWVAVRVRRKFESEGLIVASVAVVVIFGILLVVLGSGREGFLLAPALTGMLGGVGASSYIVNRLAGDEDVSDPLPEVLGGALGFVAGAGLGFFVGLPLIFMGLPNIG